MIFVDTNVVSESLKKTPDESVAEWLIRHDSELALSTVVIGEIAYGVNKIHPDQRAARLQAGLDQWCRRYADRIFGFTQEAALAYGEIMGTAVRKGRTMSAPDGMIAAIAHIHGAKLATRNMTDFETTPVDIISPWDF